MTDPTPNTPWNRPNWEEDPPKHSPPVVPCWMTKREYFAALAMQGIVAGIESLESAGNLDIPWGVSRAVQIADALIEELEK